MKKIAKETTVAVEVEVPATPVYPNRTTLKALSKRFTALSIPVQVHGANAQIFFTDGTNTVELEIHRVNELSTQEWIDKAKQWSESDKSAKPAAVEAEAPIEELEAEALPA